jgi:hypothetical protein
MGILLNVSFANRGVAEGVEYADDSTASHLAMCRSSVEKRV